MKYTLFIFLSFIGINRNALGMLRRASGFLPTVFARSFHNSSRGLIWPPNQSNNPEFIKKLLEEGLKRQKEQSAALIAFRNTIKFADDSDPQTAQFNDRED